MTEPKVIPSTMIVIDHNNTSNTIVDKAMHLTLLLTKGLQLAANLQYAKRETEMLTTHLSSRKQKNEKRILM